MGLEHEAGSARPPTIRFVGSEIFTVPAHPTALVVLQSAEWKILLPFFGVFLHVGKVCAIFFSHDDDHLLIGMMLECKSMPCSEESKFVSALTLKFKILAAIIISIVLPNLCSHVYIV